MKRIYISLFISIIFSFLNAANAAEFAIPFSSSAYKENSSIKGVVLISANWGRKWKCGRFDNAQLRSLSFDKVGNPKESDEDKADLIVEDGSFLPASLHFVNYAYIVEPGEYQMSGFSIKTAQSISDVGYFNGKRSNLIQDGKSKAGSFTVEPREIVYIGHFFLDCAKDPIPWRYYPSDRGDFNQFLSGIKKEFDAIEIEKVKFRLFDTTTMGNPFTLP
ncbi:MAG TPA: hypothetical protein VIE65_08000 [Methylobacter sp.]|jgi:hypothetical protein